MPKFLEFQGQLIVFRRSIDLSVDEMWFIVKNKNKNKNQNKNQIKNVEVLARMWHNHRTLGCIYDPVMMERMTQYASQFECPEI